MLLAMAFCWTRWARLNMCVVLRVGKLIEFYHIWYFGSYCRSGFDGLGIQNEKVCSVIIIPACQRCRMSPWILSSRSRILSRLRRVPLRSDFRPSCFRRQDNRWALAYSLIIWSHVTVHTWFSSNESWSWYFQMSLGLFCISSASKRSFGTAGVGLAD